MSKATRRFIVNKVLEMLITLVVVTLISFLLVRLSPIDPAEAYARRSFAAFSFTDEQMEALREDMGLNDPLPVQYVTWVRDALHLDFGKSFVSGQPVFEKVTTAIGITVTIVLISAVIQAGFILLFGCLCYLTRKTSVYKGYKQDKIEMRGDRAEMSDFPLYLNTVAGGLDRRDQTIGGFSFVVKIYAVPVVEIIG